MVDEDVQVVGIDKRVLGRRVEEVRRVAHDELIERSARCDQHRRRPSAAPARATRALPRRRDGSRIARHDAHVERADVDAEFQRVGRHHGSNAAVAQASAADLESARLLYQSELASDYFQVQGLDADRVLLEQTVRSYEEYLKLTQDRFQGGVVSMADVALAQTQLEGARAQLADVGIARAQFEHAIAVLTGRSPSELSIPPVAAQPSQPVAPVGLPSSLLERRSDIAAPNEGSQLPISKSVLPRRRSIPS